MGITCWTNLFDTVGDAGRYVMTPMAWVPSLSWKEVFLNEMTAQEFHDDYLLRFHTAPSYLAASQWGAISALVQGIEAADSIAPAAVAQALKEMTVESLYGLLSFDENGQTMQPMLATQVPFNHTDTNWIAPVGVLGVKKAIYPLPSFTERQCYSMEASQYGEEAGVCSLCSPGRVSVMEGALDEFGAHNRKCKSCLPGHHAASSSSDASTIQFCSPCETGRYMDTGGATECALCAEGFFMNDTGATACQQCVPSTSTAIKGTVVCGDCDMGRFQHLHGQSRCLSCSPGFFARLDGQTVCTACAPGTANDGRGANGCFLCGAGTFSAQPQQVSCTGCAHGAYSPGPGATSCTACGGHLETANTHSTLESDCRCPEGTFRPNRTATVCAPCPSGMDCSNSSEPPLVEAGYWAEVVEDDAVYSVYRCRDQLQCLKGVVGENCARGRVGLGCGVCRLGMTPRAATGECEACSTALWKAVCITVAGVLLVVLFGVSVVSVNVITMSLDVITITICVGQLVVLVQTLTVLRDVEVEWPRLIGDGVT